MLPIKKAVLFKHGVGYFERQGEVEGDEAVDLPFKAAEMNDVLKSLTTLDLSGGTIASISYESTKPIERQLEDTAIRLPDTNTLTALLSQIKGARVRAHVGHDGPVEGTVIGVENVPTKVRAGIVPGYLLTLLVDGSALRSLKVEAISSLELLDEALRKDLQHLLDILIGAKKKDLKRLTIFSQGEGRRSLLVSYVVETPVWKTSYRVLLRDEKQPLIQGWALVDNTQDEDWEGVQLTLVSGLPISFVHDLYSPRYRRRPVVEVQEEEAYAPPILEEPVARPAADPFAPMAGDPFGAPAGADPFGAPAAGGELLGGAMPGSSILDTRAAARERSVPVQTRTVEAGDQFRYSIEHPVTVRRNQSALVPILQTEFEGKRVALYNPDVREKNPMSALQFVNTTGLTLEGGPVTVLEDETYVGEAMLETLKPGEERLVPFSVELGCLITIDHRSHTERVHRVVIADASMALHSYQVRETIYLIKNKNERALDLFLDHAFRRGWELVDTPPPVEETEHFQRFRLEVAPGEAMGFSVRERTTVQETHAVLSVNYQQVEVWVERGYLDDATRETLRGLAEIGVQIADQRRLAAQYEREDREIVHDQERLRKNLGSVKSESDALRQRYLDELVAQEDRLAECRSALRTAREEAVRLEAKLRRRAMTMSYDAEVG